MQNTLCWSYFQFDQKHLYLSQMTSSSPPQMVFQNLWKSQAPYFEIMRRNRDIMKDSRKKDPKKRILGRKFQGVGRALLIKCFFMSFAINLLFIVMVSFLKMTLQSFLSSSPNHYCCHHCYHLCCNHCISSIIIHYQYHQNNYCHHLKMFNVRLSPVSWKSL